jgi:hypothetical protein
MAWKVSNARTELKRRGSGLDLQSPHLPPPVSWSVKRLCASWRCPNDPLVTSRHHRSRRHLKSRENEAVEQMVRHVRFFNRAWESSSAGHSPCGWLVTRVGHASFRGQHLMVSGCHKHWSDGMGSLALGRAFAAQQTYAASPMPSSTWADEPAESGSWDCLVRSCGGLLRLQAELGAVDPHRMKDHGELAGDRHQGTFAPLRPRQPVAPCLERRSLA